MISRKSPSSLEESTTPNSSAKSSTTVNSSASLVGDSVYFPGCLKNANCSCEICLASFNATIDLMPRSSNKLSLTKRSTSRRRVSRSPVSFDPSYADFATPIQMKHVLDSPILKSTAIINPRENVEKGCKGLGFGVFWRRYCLGLVFLLGVEYGVSWMVSEILKTRFSPEIMKTMCGKSQDFEGLNARLFFLEKELEMYAGKRVSNCSSNGSLWRISQDGMLLNSRCVLYESMTEEISIWGWSLQTAGLLTSQYSSRSFSILSGRVAQWVDGEAIYLIRESNSSWFQGKWSASVLQFDPNTWVLEYKQSFLMNNPRLFSAAFEYFKLQRRRAFLNSKRKFWFGFAFGNMFSRYTGGSISFPT